MYVCFCEDEKERIWDGGEIKFVNDFRRIIQTILVKRIAKNSLASSYASLEAILENVGCGIYVMDTQENTMLYTNQHFRKAFGEDVRSAGIEECLRQGAQSEDSLYFREVYSKEENRWFDLHSTRINWVDGRKVLLCTIYDVTDKKLYQQKIERQANNDFLTGLYNRMRCEQDLERYIRQTKEFGGEGALLYIDLDDFKHINDGLGHQYGDVLLKNISGSLQRIPGVENNCYRMGGDEFIIILAHHHMAMLQQILDEIKALFTKPWMLKGTDYYCTMSMGVVRFPADGDNNGMSWNCGAEGETDDPAVMGLRRRLVKNAFAALLCSRGPAMFFAGDEFCNTQYGNNNAYCQDNIISWLDWNRLEEFQEIHDFARFMIHFRAKHPILRRDTKPAVCGLPSVSVHNGEPNRNYTDYNTHLIGIMYAGRNADDTDDDMIFYGMNAYWEPLEMRLPSLPESYHWKLVVNTFCEYQDGADFEAQTQGDQTRVRVPERSTVILLAEHDL